MIPKRKLEEFSKEAVATLLVGALLVIAVGTSAHAPSPAQESNEHIIVPAGAALTVTVDQALSSKTSQAGQVFSATLARPVIVHGKTVMLTQ